MEDQYFINGIEYYNILEINSIPGFVHMIDMNGSILGIPGVITYYIHSIDHDNRLMQTTAHTLFATVEEQQLSEDIKGSLLVIKALNDINEEYLIELGKGISKSRAWSIQSNLLTDWVSGSSIQIATEEEAVQGIDDTKIMTPAKVFQSIQHNSQSGSVQLGSLLNPEPDTASSTLEVSTALSTKINKLPTSGTALTARDSNIVASGSVNIINTVNSYDYDNNQILIIMYNSDNDESYLYSIAMDGGFINTYLLGQGSWQVTNIISKTDFELDGITRYYFVANNFLYEVDSSTSSINELANPNDYNYLLSFNPARTTIYGYNPSSGQAFSYQLDTFNLEQNMWMNDNFPNEAVGAIYYQANSQIYFGYTINDRQLVLKRGTATTVGTYHVTTDLQIPSLKAVVFDPTGFYVFGEKLLEGSVIEKGLFSLDPITNTSTLMWEFIPVNQSDYFYSYKIQLDSTKENIIISNLSYNYKYNISLNSVQNYNLSSYVNGNTWFSILPDRSFIPINSPFQFLLNWDKQDGTEPSTQIYGIVTTPSRIYINNQLGNIAITPEAISNSAVQRDMNGRIKVNAPLDEKDVVNKQFIIPFLFWIYFITKQLKR